MTLLSQIYKKVKKVKSSLEELRKAIKACHKDYPITVGGVMVDFMDKEQLSRLAEHLYSEEGIAIPELGKE